MLQAISLETSIDGAKALSFSYSQLVPAISKKENVDTSLTAIVDDDLDRNDPDVEFALGTLERTGIAVAVAGDLPMIAEKARVELMA